MIAWNRKEKERERQTDEPRKEAKVTKDKVNSENKDLLC